MYMQCNAKPCINFLYKSLEALPTTTAASQVFRNAPTGNAKQDHNCNNNKSKKKVEF